MRDRLITAPAGQVSGADFLRAITGRPPMGAAEKAEREARSARTELLIVIEKAEYFRAHRERDAIIAEGTRTGESHEQWRDRINRPLRAARQRVSARIADFDRKVAA